MAQIPSLGENPTLMDVVKTFPDTFRPLMEYHERLLRSEDSPLTTAQREMIAAYVSKLNGCRYCDSIHTATAELFGISEGVIDLFVENPAKAPIEKEMIPLLNYARKLTEDPTAMNEQDAQDVYDAGWSERALFETAAVTSLFNLMNRLVEGLGVTFDPAYSKESAKRLEKIGYVGFADLCGAK